MAYGSAAATAASATADPGRRHAYEQLTPRTTALVVVDLVPFFVDANPQCLPAASGIDRLATQLRELGGTVTNVCCESSVRDASTLGYRVVMVAELNVGGDDATRRATFTVVYRTFGDVRTSSEVAELLQQRQGLGRRP